jgi:hypothetical protein
MLLTAALSNFFSASILKNSKEGSEWSKTPWISQKMLIEALMNLAVFRLVAGWDTAGSLHVRTRLASWPPFR